MSLPLPALSASALGDLNDAVVGIDLDPRCAKMCALNLLLQGIRGDVYQGNALSGDMQTVWEIRGPWITERNAPKTPIEEPGKQLTLL